MKVVLAVDSFKGTLSSEQAENILAKHIRAAGIECVCIPLADGGEGLIDSLSSTLQGEIVRVRVTDPNGEKVTAKYLLRGDTAILETAEAAGLPLSHTPAPDTTTYGVGEMILDAEKRGATRFVLGLGGSATTDGGCGMAAALGAKFLDEKGESFVPVGRTLSRICKIIPCEKRNITALCDVQNPLFGALGAAYVFAPQKGANAEEVALLDNGLRHLHGVWLSQGFGDLNVEGAGAAGGLGAGVLAFSNGKLQSGIHTVLDLLDFDAAVCGAQYVITGEGRLDSQSFGGKVIDGVLRRKGDARVLAVVGISLLENAQNYGIERVFETNYEHLPFEQVKERAKEDMEICAQTVANYLRGCL